MNFLGLKDLRGIPILIGGQAMEYYDIRKSGKDIDFVITDKDYQSLAGKYPEKRKDLYDDMGVTIDEFEIWRSIAHLDYGFFGKEAVDEGDILLKTKLLRNNGKKG